VLKRRELAAIKLLTDFLQELEETREKIGYHEGLAIGVGIAIFRLKRRLGILVG
jgi:hypothetical protein